MNRTSVPGNDRGGILPAVLVLAFLILCVLCAASAASLRYARYAWSLETAFRSGLEKQNAEVENEND